MHRMPSFTVRYKICVQSQRALALLQCQHSRNVFLILSHSHEKPALKNVPALFWDRQVPVPLRDAFPAMDMPHWILAVGWRTYQYHTLDVVHLQFPTPSTAGYAG